MSYDFTTYAKDPWDQIDQNEREWYDPFLRERYARSAVYSPYATMRVDLGALKTRKITFSDLIAPMPDLAPIAERQMTSSRLYTDSYNREVTVLRYGNGIAIHRVDELFSYWKANGDAGLLPIIEQHLAGAMVDHIDLLARNEFFRSPYGMFGTGTGTGFASVTTNDRLGTKVLDDLWLGMGDRVHNTPSGVLPVGPLTGSEPVIITTRGALYDLKRENTAVGGPNFVEVQKYQGSTDLLTGEIGMYRNFRLVENPLALLWNCGTIVHQTEIKAAVNPGDGAPDPETTKVLGTRMVGQRGAKHYIEVADASGFSVGDMVTIHGTRASAAGTHAVLNGVQYDDETIQNVQIVAIDTGATPDRIVVNKPYMHSDGLTVDLGSTVFGWVTKARNIHTALVLDPSKPNGLVAGVAQPPRVYTPIALDDYMSMYRISYDMWMRFQLWNPEAFECVFLAGTNRDRNIAYTR